MRTRVDSPMRPRLLMLALALAAVALATPQGHAFDEEVKTIATRPGVTQAFLLVKPDRQPVAAVILFAGGLGFLNLSERGIGWGAKNFLVRSRNLFAERGFLVAVVDAPSDAKSGHLSQYRLSDAHAQDMAGVVAFLKQIADVPVWLVGTSLGTLSAANAAARLKQGGADGLVLTATVTRPSWLRPYSVTDVNLHEISLPTLFVHHRNDACRATPYEDIPAVMQLLKRAPKVELLSFDGGAPPRSDPCEALSNHGFLGLEAAVVDAITAWIRGAPSTR